MASFSTPPPPPSSSRGRWIYDVFINFGSEDTRKIFIGHLYKALEQKSIKTFIDGDDPDLLTTIQVSKISIVVFSKNYASSSTRCLKQLVHILDHMDPEKHIVVPIFYQVDPSHVRKLAGSLQPDHGSNASIEEMQNWRDDAKFIEDIVQDIFSKLLQLSNVFINFRGEDTRLSFVAHLHKALYQKAIHAFSDLGELNKGDEISNLFNDIQKSSISIVIFSKGYAQSTWCLRELVEILECVDRKIQKVCPVFYGVSPSEVRKITGPFGDAFYRYNDNSRFDVEEVKRWRYALTRAANYSGFDRIHSKNDAELIEKIVQHTWRACRDFDV
ncbi:disease resistance protein RPV1-like isoform X2 [Malus domestica]|uniref:disease resistance protein RPV1-like isoform X2 n=1 Tax=Malus domestica TaxID=3750 RepID=UPI0004992EF1|nr:disease resistance protein RPP4-like isoform X2 [Malus domestica]